MPGFLPRLRASLIAALHDPTQQPSTPTSSITMDLSSPADSAPAKTLTPTSGRRSRPPRQPVHPYQALLPLSRHVSLLNDPSPPPGSLSSAGSAPAFSPSLLGWIGGSLAGALRVGSKSEVGRELWDEAREGRLKRERARIKSGASAVEGGEEEVVVDLGKGGVEVLGDWTRW